MKIQEAKKYNPAMKNHMMVDVEALRLNQPWKAPLLQIGVVVFTPYGTPLFSEGVYIHQDSQPKDVSAEQSTLNWWSNEKRIGTFKDIMVQCETCGVDPEEALNWLNHIYQSMSCGPIWFAGPQYDKIIIDNYSEVCGVPQAWNYDDVRCFRTIRMQHPDLLEDWDYKDYTHNAVNDALDQVARLRHICSHRGIVWL